MYFGSMSTRGGDLLDELREICSDTQILDWLVSQLSDDDLAESLQDMKDEISNGNL